MMRINLLAAERGAAKKTRAVGGVTTAQRVTIAAALILLSTVVSVGWWYWSLQTQSRQLDEDIARAEVEARQLRSVLAQVQKFESSKAQLQQRVTLIEQLRRGQSGPVHILDEIVKAVPDRLWLTELTQKGDDIVLAGMTTSFTGLSDFVANLEGSKWFKKPIDIVDSQVTTDAKTGDIFKFSVKAVFNNPEAPPPPPTPAAGRGRGGVPAKKPGS
jgi:type IV pilus assembly protein PilN